MFWHGLSLVSSRVKTLWSHSEGEKHWSIWFVLGDDRHHRTAAFIGNQMVSLLWSGCGFISLNVTPVSWRPGSRWVFSAVHYTMRPRRVGEVDRFPPPQVPPAVLCWFGWFQERPACCRSSPHPFFILLSIRSSFHLSICYSKTVPPSDWVNESRVPLKASCCCSFLRCSVIFCIRAGRSVGGLVGGQLLSCGLFLCFFYFRL